MPLTLTETNETSSAALRADRSTTVITLVICEGCGGTFPPGWTGGCRTCTATAVAFWAGEVV